MEINWRNIAQAAYEAYADSTDNKNFRGEDMPKWGELPEKIQVAWVAAVIEACKLYRGAVTA